MWTTTMKTALFGAAVAALLASKAQAATLTIEAINATWTGNAPISFNSASLPATVNLGAEFRFIDVTGDHLNPDYAGYSGTFSTTLTFSGLGQATFEFPWSVRQVDDSLLLAVLFGFGQPYGGVDTPIDDADLLNVLFNFGNVAHIWFEQPSASAVVGGQRITLTLTSSWAEEDDASTRFRGFWINSDGDTPIFAILTAEPIPEPASLALFAAGLLGLSFAARRRAR